MTKVNTTKIRGEPAATRAPTAEDFTADAVNREVLKYTLQHPATIYPVTGAAVAAMAGFAVGFSPLLLGLALGAGAVGAGAWVVNFVIRGETLAARHVNHLRELRRTTGILQADELAQKCEELGFSEGHKEAEELRIAYERLRAFLDNEIENQPETGRYVVLAEDAYQEGLQALSRALNTFQALSEVDGRALESELMSWRKQRDAKAKGEIDAALDDKIASHERRLEQYESAEAEVEALLAKSNSLEGALEQAYLELSRGRGSLDFQPQGSFSQLEIAMKAARAVEEKLRGTNTTNDDVRYERLGQEKE